jgi:ribose transport system substrate-binding protein
MIARKLVASFAVLAATVLILVGCSSSGQSSGGSGSTAVSTSSGSASASSGLQAEAEAKVTAYESATHTYPGPTTPFNPGTGTTGVMGCGFDSTICAEMSYAAVNAVHAMGWKTAPAFDGQNSPAVESGWIDQAVQDKLNGIILVSVDPHTILSAIKTAIAAHMPIMCTNCASGALNGHGVTDVATDYTSQGVIAAWKIMAENGGKAKVFSFYDNAFLSAVDRSVGLKETIEANCKTCTVDLQAFPSSDYGEPGPPEWTAILSTHPAGSFTNAMGHYDGLSITMAKTDMQSGRTDIKISGYDGESDALAAIASGSPPYDFTVAEPAVYEQWAAADLLGRIKAGVPLWSGASDMPSELVTKANAAVLLKGNPAGSPFPAPVGNWEANFEKLWGKG